MAKKNALTTDEIIRRCEKVGLTYVSHYIDNEKRSTVVIAKCQCGEEIKISIQNLGTKVKQGKTCSCKKCGAKKVNVNTIEKAKQKFLQALNENGHELLSEYITSNEKVLIDFKCGHEPHWMTPSCYMCGQRCPKCYIERKPEMTKQQMASMTYEEKEQWKHKIKNTLNNKTEEEKAIISKKISEGQLNMTEQAKQQRSQKMSEKTKQWHISMTQEQKKQWKYKKSIAIRGNRNPMWNSNLTDEERKYDRTYFQVGYSDWKKQVKINANFTCDCCGKHGDELHSHHLNDYHTHKELATDINNGVCLCKGCHMEFHSWMGGTKIECTEQDYLEFKQMKQEQFNTEETDSVTDVA